MVEKMMDNQSLPDRLRRAPRPDMATRPLMTESLYFTCREAADEIECLRDALRGLLEMAEDLASTFPIKLSDDGVNVVAKARSVLSTTER